MKIDPVIHDISYSQARSQVDVPSNVMGSNKRLQNNDHTASTLPAINQSVKQDTVEKQGTDKKAKEADSEFFKLKAVFALDDDKNVVIRLLDDKGEVVRQYPPKEYLTMVKKFNEIVDNLYSKRV